MREFYWLWIKKAFSNALGQIELWTGLGSAVLITICHFVKNGDKIVSSLLWQIPVWVLASVMGVRLILAPYWVWKDTKEKLLEAQKAEDSTPKTPLEIFEEYLQRQAGWLERYSNCSTKNVQARSKWIENTMKGYETACGQIKAQYFVNLVRHHETNFRGEAIEKKIIEFLNSQKEVITSSQILTFTERDLKKFETTIDPC